MGTLLKIIFTAFLFLLLTANSFAQTDDEDEFEQMLIEEVEVQDPVYKPVIAFGVGSLNFLGDVNDFYSGLWGTQPGFRVNVMTFLDRTRYYKLNFFMLYGKLSGNERSYADPERNLNFQSEIMNFGINLEYSFRHLFRRATWQGRVITPFISAGIETFQFNSKADLYNSDGILYQYWSDGTIRDIPETSPDAHESVIIRRNYVYESDLRSANLYGMGDYPQISLAVPLDFGIDFRITERVNMRVASSVHFTFTDMIDNISSGITGITGNNRNDRFSYSYVTFHLDLFSDPKTILLERLYADVDFDYTLIEDEDGDGVFDFWDDCPGTPPGVAVDEFGCPIDSDGDGVPDYLDLEPNTRPGAFIDEYGREISAEHLAELLSSRENAVNRDEMERYATLSAYRYQSYSFDDFSGIPDEYRFLDIDRDGFLSFEELINAINLFFDGEANLTSDDIYKLMDLLFLQ